MTSQNFQEIDAQALKDTNPIEDVIGQYLHLKRRGKDYVGLCPFHDEKSPSFTVSPSKQLYHCFGCGESGNVFNFLMKHQNINFREAVEELGGKISTNSTVNRTKTLLLKAKKAVKPIPFAVGGKFLRLPEIPCDSPEPRPISDENWAVIAGKDNVPSNRDIIQESIYKYSDIQEVRRFDWPDTTKPKGRGKTIRPFYLKAGKWQIGKGDDAWPIYRLDEVLDIAASSEEETIYLFLAEGESNVEIYRAHGFAAITPRGGTWREEDLKTLATTRQNSGKNFALICLTDNDKHGQDMAKDILPACTKFGFSCLLISADIILPGIIEGGDIREILAEMDIEEFLRRVGEQISINANNAAIIDPPQSNVISLPVQQRLSEQELEKEIKKIIEDDPKKSEVNRRLNALTNRTERRDFNAVKEQYQALTREYQNDILDKPKQAEVLKEIADLRGAKLDPKRYLHGADGRFAQQLTETAEAMPMSASWLFTTLITASASLIKADSKIIIKGGDTGYTQSVIFRSLIVANTGAKKTPAQMQILKPLFKWEWEANQRYQEEKKEYQAEMRQYKSKDNPEAPPDTPLRKRYILSDTTPEAMVKIHNENPNGFLVYRDEGSGFYSAMNKYRGGKGDDQEFDLSLFNGNPAITDRKGDENGGMIMHPHVCYTGSTQIETFKELMGNFDDAAGYWSRWLIDMSAAPLPYCDLENDFDNGFHEALMNLYQALADQESKNFGLSLPAKKLWQAYQHSLVDRQMACQIEGLRNIYPKLEAYFGRFCLWLHLINAALAGKEPEPTIDEEMVKLAAELTTYYESQWILFHNTQNPELANLTEQMLAIHEFAKRKGKPVAPRDLQSGLRQIKAVSAAQIREWCEVLSQTAGYGSWDGKAYSHNASADGADGLLTNCQHIQTHTPYSVGGFADNADKNSTLPKNTPTEETGIASKKEIYVEGCKQRQQTPENLTGHNFADADNLSANHQHCQQNSDSNQTEVTQESHTANEVEAENHTQQVFVTVDALNAAEIGMIASLSAAAAQNDRSLALATNKKYKALCKGGVADKEKIWKALGKSEGSAFKALIKPMIGEKVVIEPDASAIYGGKAGKVLEVTGSQAKIKVDGGKSYSVEIKYLSVVDCY